MEIKSVGHRVMMSSPEGKKMLAEVMVAQRVEGKCPNCRKEVSIAIPNEMIDYRLHYEDLEKKFEKLLIEYYAEGGYYRKNKELKRLIANIDHIRDIDFEKIFNIIKELKKIKID